MLNHENHLEDIKQEINLNEGKNILLKKTYKQIENELYLYSIRYNKLLGKDDNGNEYYVILMVLYSSFCMNVIKSMLRNQTKIQIIALNGYVCQNK